MKPFKKVVAPYAHFFPPVQKSIAYPSKYKFILVDTHEKLDMMINGPSARGQIFACDTETTSLDHTVAKIVGMSFCFDFSEAYYIPLRHDKGNIADTTGAEQKIKEMISGRNILYYNSRYDLRIIKAGGVYAPHRSFDVQLPVWNSDTNVKQTNLKWGMSHFLGWDVTTFEKMFGKMSIAMFSPEYVLSYAATDALGTYHLFFRLKELLGDEFKICYLDNDVLPIVSMIEETPLYIDVRYLRKLLPHIDATLIRMKHTLFRLNGGEVFNPASWQQVGRVLLKNGCAPPLNKKGVIPTDIKTLIKINHPLTQALCVHSSLNKVRSSYIAKLIKQGDTKQGKLFISHKVCGAVTGRLAAGADKDNPFFSEVNIMSIPKAAVGFYRPSKSDGPRSLIGWDFEYVGSSQTELGLVEGFDPTLNVRSAFYAPVGYVWVSIDYATQEVRLPANFCREPVFVNAFLNREDIHREVAKAVFGSVDKKKRSTAKAVTFAMLYGGTEYTIADRIGCPIEEAREYVQMYKAAHPILFRWFETTVRMAYRLGYVSTYYGRPRRLRHYLTSPDRGLRAFGERSAQNSPIQGTAADLLKIALIRIYNGERNAIDNSDLILYPLVHDEINFLCRVDKVLEIIPRVMKVMTIQEKDWVIPMEVEASFGHTWGTIFPFSYKDGVFSPKV
jgi:DNA polymerase-1